MQRTFLFHAVPGVGLKAPDVEPAQVAEKLLEIFEGNLQLGGNFRLTWVASESRLARENRLLQTPGLAPQRPRTPVDLAKTVEDCAANAKFGIVLELNIFARIIFLYGIDQAEYPCVNEIFQKHLWRKTVVDPPGDVLHLWQMLEQHFFTTW